jgi:hypothetical protein
MILRDVSVYIQLVPHLLSDLIGKSDVSLLSLSLVLINLHPHHLNVFLYLLRFLLQLLYHLVIVTHIYLWLHIFRHSRQAVKTRLRPTHYTSAALDGLAYTPAIGSGI